VRVIFSKIVFTLPGGFFLRVIIPLYLAKLDGLGACNPLCYLQYLDWLLLICQITFELYFFEWYSTFSGVFDISG
jgi:hypothetical protein